MAVIRPEGGSTPATLKGAHRDVHLAQQGLRTDRPGVEVSHAAIPATGHDVGALELLRLQSHLGLENRPRHFSELREDGQRCRGHVVEVWGLQDLLDKTFAPIEELVYDELVVHGVPPDEKR